MEWIRKVSLVKRMMIGFVVMAVLMALIGGSTLWALQDQATPRARTALQLTGALTIAGVLFALLGGWAIVASIKQSVESTVQCVIRIAGGDLETKITSPGRDEISWLRGELNGMRKKLRTMVLDVRQTVDGVNSASEEIASGNVDLSNRTESQASALEQTNSSMQQLAETVRSNTESTNEARKVVTVSSEVAARGASIMRDVIARMGEINTSATKISEIIGVIDGIAFQTNILALNAAVEAARAGEHGRGFAVVASEVRSLAQRSSTAAREIKTLIGDSSEKVSAGSRLVDDAGRTMQEILDSVKSVAGLIGDIAEASQSQNSGISQVHQAIAHIDSMTHQNAALVEELAAAAQSLKGQTGRLTSSMSSFQVVA
ncbi:methyl-accepting chemotaxis protein [Aquabacterium sp.]|uniref:methyl-accepting chemotaxis protein n=1 Tax=Aquabacterium sp. TaxID=1872578 RepID=UPI002CEEC9D3|nr:methyl-accepting chemotaxis protein [Aquabacterium sp.]HSW03887.1 methyl-accepting chemotaxis protein [Aquabacterium sp.]